MYTVLRFVGPPTQLDKLENELKSVAPNAYEGRDCGYANRTSCSISRSNNWNDHVESIMALLGRLESVIQDARNSGIQLEVDTAIDPEDYMQGLYSEVFLTDALIGFFHRLGIMLHFPKKKC
jgi:hypothetical protein